MNKLTNFTLIADLHLLLNTFLAAFREAFIFTDRHVHTQTLERLFFVYGRQPSNKLSMDVLMSKWATD